MQLPSTISALKNALAPLACAAICLHLASPAKADLVFLMNNISPVEVKATMHNVGVVYLRVGQSESIRHEGDWVKANCPMGVKALCAEPLRDEYFAHIAQLGRDDVHLCNWRVKREFEMKPDFWAMGRVVLKPTLVTQAPGYQCTVEGQMAAVFHSAQAPGNGLTIRFNVAKAP